MGDAQLCFVTVALLLSSSVTSLPVHNGISASEIDLIRRIEDAIPGDENLRGGDSEWSIVRSISGESQATPQELEIIRGIVDAIPGDTYGGGGGRDWNIVRSIELQRSQFEDGYSLDKPSGSFGGSIDAPLLRPEPPMPVRGGTIDAPTFNMIQADPCGPNAKLIHGRCRMIFQ